MAINQYDTMTLPMPTPGAGGAMGMVEIALIEESLTNPRKHFDQQKLRELADSIAASGVHQPILVRPLPGHRVPETFGFRRKDAPLPVYELVAGARRLRACKLAKLKEVPAMIREMSDAQVLEAQIVENLQRDDVTPLEEAEGYETLMRETGITADAVAVKIGKSRSYVFGRLKLLDLCAEVRKHLREGELDASRALLIARIPNHSQQIEACDDVLRCDMSHREAAAHIQRDYMLYLRNARFDIEDATLCSSAGACKTCPKNTGTNRELFADVKSADMCTDSDCYHAKEKAHQDRALAQAHAKGWEIITGKEAKAIMPHSWSTSCEGYLRLDHPLDSPTDQPLRALIGGVMEAQGITPTLIQNPHNDSELVAVLRPEQVTPLLAAVGQDTAAKRIEKDSAHAAKVDKDKATAANKTRYEEQWRLTLALDIADTLRAEPRPSVPDHIIRMLAVREAASMNTDQAAKFCKALNLGKVAPIDGAKEWAEGHCMPATALLTLLAWRDKEYRYWLHSEDTNPYLRETAEALDIDVTQVQKNTKAKLAAEAKAAAAKAKKSENPVSDAAPKGASTPTPAAPAAKSAREKSKKAKAPAAPAPKLSAGEAQAQIAAAMQAAAPADREPEPGAAAAAQGNEAAPVAAEAAQELPPSSTSTEAGQAADDGQQQPAGAQAAAAGDGQASAGVETGAALEPGTRVRIKPLAAIAAKHEHLKQHVGELRYPVGSKLNTWRVAFPDVLKRGIPAVESFGVSQLEVL